MFGFFIPTAISNYRIWLSFFFYSHNLHQKAFCNIHLHTFSVCTLYVLRGWFCIKEIIFFLILLKICFGEKKSTDVTGMNTTCERRAGVSDTVNAEHVSTICICIFLIHVCVFRMGYCSWFSYTLMPKCYCDSSGVRQHKWVFCALQQRLTVSVFSCYPQADLAHSSSGIGTWHTLVQRGC